jgi:glycosyltransferase involved in cell wall biosynthesis
MRNVSIIMPCYNAEKFLSRSLHCILYQLYHDWVVYFVDDGSTDSSFEIASNFAKSDARFKVFKGDNQGVSAARNFAKQLILNSENNKLIDLVAYCDADDFFLPKKLSTMVSYMNDLDDIDFLYTGVKCRFPDGTEAFPKEILQPPFDPPIYTSTVMHKVSCFKVGDFDSRINGREDWDYWFRIKKAGFCICDIPDILTVYTVRSDGVASTWNYEKEVIFRGKMSV